MAINLTFPREIASPKRKLVYNQIEYYTYINQHIKHKPLFTPVYNYTSFNYLSVPDSAIIDRIFFDLDNEQKIDNKTIPIDCYGNMLKLHNWCKKFDYKHTIRYTGSGFDCAIFTTNDFIDNKKDCIFTAVDTIEKELGIYCDPKVKGDISRICRITNSFNFKPKSNRFVVSLSEELINSDYDTIREFAKKQYNKIHIFGNRLLNIKPYDKPLRHEFEDFISADYEIDTNTIKVDDLGCYVPDCIKYLLSKHTPNYSERFAIITGLRDLAYNEQEILTILQKYLSKQKFYHCVYEEGQVSHLVKSQKYLFPTKQEIMKLKACPYKNEYCDIANRGCLNYERTKKIYF